MPKRLSHPAYLILHGWGANSPGHWQTWLAGRLRERGSTVRYPTLPDFDEPKLQAWLGKLHDELDAFRGESLVVVAHSLAVLLWLHFSVRSDGGRAERVVLVAPPSAASGVDELADFFPVPLDPAAVNRVSTETLLVCSDRDDYCPEGAKALFGDPLRIDTFVIEGGAHLNVDAGYGEWTQMEKWVVEGWTV